MGITMPWINLTLRRGALSKPVQHAMMTKLTEVLMWWEKVPDTLVAGKFMKGWVYEVAEDADYNAGSPHHDKPFYFLEIRIPINRLDLLSKQGAESPVRPIARIGVACPRFEPTKSEHAPLGSNS
jgi:hypothetical protein